MLSLPDVSNFLILIMHLVKGSNKLQSSAEKIESLHSFQITFWYKENARPNSFLFHIILILFNNLKNPNPLGLTEHLDYLFYLKLESTNSYHGRQ